MSQEKSAEIIDLGGARLTPPDGVPVGEFLANARRAARLGHAAVFDATKIKTSHLEAIEAGDKDSLPATPYAVGFVKAYAEFLGLDADAVADRFKAEITPDVVEDTSDVAAASTNPRNSGEGMSALSEVSTGTKLVSLLGIFAILIFGIWIVVQVASAPAREAARAEPERRVVLGNDPVAPLRPMVTSEAASAPASDQISDQASELVSDQVGDATVLENVLAASEDVQAEGEVAPSDITASATENMESPGADDSAAAGDAPEDASAAVQEEAPVRVAETPPPATTRPAYQPAPQLTQPPVRRASVTVVAAQMTRSIAPRYPSQCDRSAEAIEKVTVLFDVTAAGRTTNPRVISSSNSCFDNAAVSAIGRWRFSPKTVDGSPRPDLGKRATLNFQK
ncbi:MAG: hypothetical protein DHS20C05_05410 [Hyphococcus sp.]|nr:MAG: hypothetical protein DHS20C05_05410 [Marinicaulis sp.]